jgi:hypothetical protein
MTSNKKDHGNSWQSSSMGTNDDVDFFDHVYVWCPTKTYQNVDHRLDHRLDNEMNESNQLD